MMAKKWALSSAQKNVILLSGVEILVLEFLPLTCGALGKGKNQDWELAFGMLVPFLCLYALLSREIIIEFRLLTSAKG